MRLERTSNCVGHLVVWWRVVGPNARVLVAPQAMGNVQQAGREGGVGGTGSSGVGAPGKRQAVGGQRSSSTGPRASNPKGRKKAAGGGEKSAKGPDNGTIAGGKSNTCQREPTGQVSKQQHLYHGCRAQSSRLSLSQRLPPLVVIDSPKNAAPRSGSESSKLAVEEASSGGQVVDDVSQKQQQQQQQPDCPTNSTSPVESCAINKVLTNSCRAVNKQPPSEKESDSAGPLIKAGAEQCSVVGGHSTNGNGSAAIAADKPKRGRVNRSVSVLNMMNSSQAKLCGVSAAMAAPGAARAGSSKQHQRRPHTEKRPRGFARQVSVVQVQSKSSVEALTFEQYQLGMDSQRRKVREWLDSQPFNEHPKVSAPFLSRLLLKASSLESWLNDWQAV